MSILTLEAFIKKNGTLQEASRLLGIPYVTLQRWRKRKTLPSRYIAALLLKAHGVKVDHR